jgi:hypothetical protein
LTREQAGAAGLDLESAWASSVMENVGVPADIEVEPGPAAIAAGQDPPLDRAIAVVPAELEKSPPAEAPARFRSRTRGGASTAGLK